jgi:transposase
VRSVRVWARLLGVEGVVVEGVALEGETVVVSVRPGLGARQRCGICHRRSPRFDAGEGRRRWRALDLGSAMTFLEADAPRVRCREHGVVVMAVPWARHGARSTRAFDDQTAWLATQISKTAIAALMRISWRTVGRIITRVAAEGEAKFDRLAGVRRLGIDEISYRKGQCYLIVVVDHDSGRLVWAAPGRDAATLGRFFERLGKEGCAAISLVSADLGSWIASTVRAYCPKAELCLDPFHIVKLATDALDEVRREVWNAARRAGDEVTARELKGARWALWKNPERLTVRQGLRLCSIQATNAPLYKAYLLKEQLRQVFQLPAPAALLLLDQWITWAQRCRLPAFVKVAATVSAHRTGIAATLSHGLSNARVEAMNTRIRLITRRAFGFHSAQALIALALLSFGGLCPPLHGRLLS